MAATAQANRARHFEPCFVEFAHSAEKLELGKSVSIFFPHTVTIRSFYTQFPYLFQGVLYNSPGR